MSDVQLLFLVLAVLYGWECACWVSRGSVGFRSWLGRRWRAAQPSGLLGNQRGGFVFANPLPPLGTLFLGTEFPLSLSPEGMVAWVGQSVNPGPRPAHTGKYFGFEEIRQVERRGKKVIVNGEVLTRSGSAMSAERLARQLRELKGMDAVKRAGAIEAMVRSGFDTKAITRKREEFDAAVPNVKRVTNALFVYLFLLAPGMIWHFGFLRSWAGLLIGLLGLTTLAAVRFSRAHKAFYPGAEDERFTHFLTVLLSPATTIRAHDILSRPLLEEFHPLAIAKALRAEADFRTFSAKLWRELSYPAQRGGPSGAQAEAVAAYWQGIFMKTVERFLKQNGIEPDKLLQPPAQAEEMNRSYCPRCLTQFTTEEGVCDDCGGVGLRGWLKTARPAVVGEEKELLS